MRPQEERPEFYQCSRCGALSIPRKTHEQRRARGSAKAVCSDCSMSASSTIDYGGIICKPWRGDLDLDSLIPLKNGLAYLPGSRLCGHSDCVEKSHIDGFDDPEDKELIAERLDISYRTGKKKNYQQLIKAARREGALHGLLHAKS